MTTLPEPGQVVIVRQRPFVVVDIQSSQLPAGPNGGALDKRQHLLKLASVEDEGLGEEMQVIWELEPGVQTLEKASLPALKGFDAPRTFDAFIDAVAWGSVSSADDKALQSPFRSGVDVDDYQLDPVVRALAMPRVNLLIADDVGLGKTIETGLVAQELILRYRARNILVVCPSSIQVQWKEEMRDKFGLEFRIVDGDLLGDLRRKRGIHVNPWDHFPRLITSIDFLKRERPMRLFRETLPSGDQPTYPRAYDLLIVDEAHNVAPSGKNKYAIDSMRTECIRTLAPHFEHKLFLSATPHNGYPESFSALLELLDSQRFARAVKPDRKQLEAVMVRRMKSELELRWDGSRRFAKRIVDHLEVPYTTEEKKLHELLKKYSDLRAASAKSEGETFATEFIMKLLKKRLFSSPEAFRSTLQKHAHTAGGVKTAQGNAWRKQVEESEEDTANDDDREKAQEEAVETATRHGHVLTMAERNVLDDMAVAATRAAGRADTKARKLIDWLTATLKPGGKWNNERVIIFTEYKTTQKWLHDLLAAERFTQDKRLEMIYGGMKRDDREAIKAAFQADPEVSPVRILLATDTASEGINLQNHCSKLIHYEIPWNPNRMEQRNGRVDRHGQKSAEVRVFHFVGEGFDATKPGQAPGDLNGDLEFLARAALKVEAIREDLGKVGPVIADQVEKAMLGKRKTLDTSKAESESVAVRSVLKFERKLNEQLEKLSKQLADTKRELRLEPENVLNVVNVGLALAGQPPLRQSDIPDAYIIPPLSGSWAHCADGLMHPHTKLVRPVMFDQTKAMGRDDVVLCHLNHRLVQMCLRLLRAEVWSQNESKKINRFTARVVPDNVLQTPAVLIHGRLLVLGGDNQRIHEEIIIAGGVIKDGRFNRMNIGEVSKAYAAATNEAVPPKTMEHLMELWPTQQDPLVKALNVRMDERTKNLEQFLDDRATRKVDNFTAVMKELERSIKETLGEKDGGQLQFEWSDDEKQQRERDMNSLRHRLAQIPDELEREVEHLRERYRAPEPRMFPVAVTFLVPRKSIARYQQGGSK
jgi:SNF2 family DNA or RNA helicase